MNAGVSPTSGHPSEPAGSRASAVHASVAGRLCPDDERTVEKSLQQPSPILSQTQLRLRTPPMMENSPVATAPEIEFPSGSPSAGSPAVEVVIPLLRSPTGAKRRRVSSLIARCVVGSLAVRLMSQMALSPSQRSQHTSRSPGAALQSSQGCSEDDDMYEVDAENDNEQTRTDGIDLAVDAANANATKFFRSACWKEFAPIMVDGVVGKGRCKHCDALIGAKRGSWTSALCTHLKRCKKRCSALKIVQDLSSTLRSSSGTCLKDWNYVPEVSRQELIRMISLHEVPFLFMECDGFRRFLELGLDDSDSVPDDIVPLLFAMPHITPTPMRTSKWRVHSLDQDSLERVVKLNAKKKLKEIPLKEHGSRQSRASKQ